MKNIFKILLVVIFATGILFFVFFYKDGIKIPKSSIEILQNRDFSELPGADKYHLISSREFSLADLFLINMADDAGLSVVNPYFQVDGSPIFFKSDPPSYEETIKTSPDGTHVLEISTSEPDMTVSLWDLKINKVYVVTQCGTACSFSGAYWISNEKFAVYGVELGYEEGDNASEDSRFVNVYNLADMMVTNYNDKL
jgi:hypothetical protein